MMRNGKALLVAVLVAGCATSQGPPEPPRKSMGQYYLEAHRRHYEGLEKWLKAWGELNKCFELNKTNPKAVQPCVDELPPRESFLPKDREGDEAIQQYKERKDDEWEEKACFYKGHMNARYIGENQRIEDQCKRDLEIKRLRKAMEKLNKQNPR
jgi:hypothetical protein